MNHHARGVFLKTVEQAVSRRAWLRHLTGGGIGAALMAVAGLTDPPAAAQEASVAASRPQRCRTRFEAVVRRGPSAGLVLRGVLELLVERSGGINEGALTFQDGTRAPVVGQANGRAINLLFRLAAGRTLIGVGTLENDILTCRGAGGGIFTGPLAADVGDWALLPFMEQN